MNKPELTALDRAFSNPRVEFEIDALFGDRADEDIPADELSVIFDFSLSFEEKVSKLQAVQRRKLN